MFSFHNFANLVERTIEFINQYLEFFVIFLRFFLLYAFQALSLFGIDYFIQGTGNPAKTQDPQASIQNILEKGTGWVKEQRLCRTFLTLFL